MKYYSTNKKAPLATLEKAVVKGLAEDRGLYMPERIKQLPQEFFDNINKMSFQEIAYTVADAFFGEDVEAESLRKIVYDTLAFDCPVVNVAENIYSLELLRRRIQQKRLTFLSLQVEIQDQPLPMVSSVLTEYMCTCSTQKER